ncbi:MAG: mechanosensitive ion channel [Sulfurimonadaceae bacterium]|jgi:small-conductance mechanosensitive channel|nr:mechanosensitive ion channel [Sulfurimonadaceae bacterium]
MDKSIILSVALIIIAFLALNIIKQFLSKIGSLKNVSEIRMYYIHRTAAVFITLLSFFSLALIWSVDFGSVLVVASSVFTIIGVALFAQWSILSNITASFIIFFSFPTRVGDNIMIIDGDNSISGEITEISLYQVEIRDVEGNTIHYPNNLFIQKPIKKMKQQTKSVEVEKIEIRNEETIVS